ncbi:MAG: type I-G CRISPR-associated protein Csb2 [Thermoguttaceae bacterium]
MPNKLIISVTFLDDLYHGQGNYEPEFPPSPLRLFQAILAANGNELDAAEPILQWFETLKPPEIYAPKSESAFKYTNYVPNNDADKKYNRQNRLTGKEVAPTRMIGGRTVFYVWNINPDDVDKANKLDEMVRRISALGWGIDLVVADAKIATELPPEITKLEHWKPSVYKNTEVQLRVPQIGTLENLKTVYKSQQNAVRIEKSGRSMEKIYTPPQKPSTFQTQSYETTVAPERPCAFFELCNPADETRFVGFDQRDLMYVSAMLRHAVLEKVKEAGRDFFASHGIDIEKYVAGHADCETDNSESPALAGGCSSQGIDRFSYLPIPTINFHRNDDGLIRRVIIAEPLFGKEGDDKDKDRKNRGVFANWVQQNLIGAALIEKNTKQSKAVLTSASGRDGIFRLYTEKSTEFGSVTPLVLPGADDFKYAKTEKLVLKSFVQAGFDLSKLKNLELRKAPIFPGAFHPRDYQRPEYFRHKSMIHIVFEFKEPAHGPIALGPGRHLGFGLCAILPNEKK